MAEAAQIDRARRLALGVTLVVTALLLVPVPASFAELGSGEWLAIGKDKLAHFALFVPLAIAWRRRLTPGSRAPLGLSLALLAALAAWGGAIELVQGATGFRRAEWSDLAADALGAALGLALPGRARL